MIYVVIDTCVFYKVWTHSVSGCEITDLLALAEFANKGTVKFIVPEVIELELQRGWRSFHAKVKDAVNDKKSKIDIALRPSNGWNEVDQIKGDISQFCDQWQVEFVKACDVRHAQVQAFLASDCVVKVSFTPDIMFNAKRLMISGAMSKSDRGDQDAYIVQSVIHQFEHKDYTKDFLYFCSQNVNDFAISTESGLALRLGVQEHLPSSFFSRDLRGLLQALEQHLPPSIPAASQVQDAEDREAIREMRILEKLSAFEIGRRLERFAAIEARKQFELQLASFAPAANVMSRIDSREFMHNFEKHVNSKLSTSGTGSNFEKLLAKELLSLAPDQIDEAIRDFEGQSLELLLQGSLADVVSETVKQTITSLDWDGFDRQFATLPLLDRKSDS